MSAITGQPPTPVEPEPLPPRALSAAPMVETIPAPETLGQAIAQLHRASMRMHGAVDKLLELAELGYETPEMRPVTINPNNNGQYTVIDKSPWWAKSIGILNPATTAPVFIGVGGMSARPAAGVPYCPAGKSIVLPVEARDLEIGCDPTVLGANSLTVFLFRFLTVQPLAISS